MLNFVNKLKTEIILAIPAIIYFTFAFNLIFYITGLTLEPSTIRHFNTWTVTLLGIMMGKILIIANAFPFLNKFSAKPLLYNIIWKFLIYMALILILWVLESLLHYFYLHKNITTSIDLIQKSFYSPIFWASLLCIGSVFLIYLIFSEFTRVLGKEKILLLLIGCKRSLP